MIFSGFKKMAGTSAVFIGADYEGAAPLERDGLLWSAEELHIGNGLKRIRELPPMANALALEGLEEYDPPSDGDARFVNSLGVEFIYVGLAKAWIQALG